jgi:DNA-binding response OmpR family regulator/DNA-binding CsgD family transcriptional regulator
MTATKTILIADDDTTGLAAVAGILEKDGYKIFTVNSGKKLLGITGQLIPDLIICDWDMPEMSGLEVLQTLKNSFETSKIPFILMSGIMVSSEHAEAALEKDAFDFVRKPVDETELRARVRAVLRLYDYLQREEALAEREQQLLKNELERKNKELERLSRSVIKRNRILNELKRQIDDILEIEKCDAEEVTVKIEKVFDEKLNSDTDWKVFRLRFEEIFPGFLSRLHSKFKEITANEEKLCAYMRIGLSNKEIAELFSVSLRSVEQARFRLRKKLDIKEREDLWSILHSV